MEFTIKKDILLPNGNTLRLDASPDFIEKIKEHFQLENVQEVDDSCIRKFIWEAFKNAVDKAEKEGG